MAVTVLERPEGFILGETVVSATAGMGGDGVSVLISGPNTLTTGDYVYIKSPIQNYNGLKYVEVIGATDFFIHDTASSGRIPAINISNINLTYRVSEDTSNWSCVHLPITYKLSNNLFPTNSVDTGRTVSSFTNDVGLVNLNLSGSLGTFEELQFVKISDAFSSEVNGIFQIIDKISSSDVTINLAYSAAYSFSGATVQLYYQNYYIKVKIYGGINENNVWTDQKPYELLGTLRLIPDEDNQVFFSVSETLKKHIPLNNSLLLGTLPNNIDAWTQFYITTQECYDISDAYTVQSFEGTEVSDKSNFEGYAANSILPFKNIYSGFLSEYIIGVDTSSAKFLTLFDTPVLFSGQYFDLSFILDNGIESQIPDLEDMLDSGSEWVLGSTPSFNATAPDVSTFLYATARQYKLGKDYTFNYQFSILGSGVGLSLSFQIHFLDSSFSSIANEGLTYTTNGTKNDSLTIPGIDTAGSSTQIAYIAVVVNLATSTGAINTVLEALSIDSGSVTEFSLVKQLILNGDMVDFEISTIDPGDQGIYRVSIEQDCDYSQYNVFIADGTEAIVAPSLWTNAAGSFDTKGATAFQEAITTTDNIITAFQGLNVPVGNVVEFSVTIQIVGTWTPQVGEDGGIGIGFYLGDSAGANVSDNITEGIVELSGTVSEGNAYTANGTFEINVKLISTGAAERLYIVFSEKIASGTSDIIITMPVGSFAFPDAVSETKSVDINCECENQSFDLSWLNYLGGFDYWRFTAEKEYDVDIVETGVTTNNIFPEWPNSYGEFSDTIRQQTFRDSKEKIVVRSQLMTLEQLNAVSFIRTSPLVQIVNSIYDRRTVIVDSDSFKKYDEADNMFSITFTIEYTNDIPSQRM